MTGKFSAITALRTYGGGLPHNNRVVIDCITYRKDAIYQYATIGEGNTVVGLGYDGFEDTDEKIKTCNTLCGSLMTHLKEYAEEHQPEPAFKYASLSRA